MFVQITNGENAKKGQSPGPNPKRRFLERDLRTTSEKECDLELGISLPQRKEEEVIEITTIRENYQHRPEDKPGENKSEIFDRLSGKASIFLPKKKNIFKLSGDKESDIKIYTIDREMAKIKTKPKPHDEAFSNPEFSDKLQRTRKNFQTNENRSFKSVGSMASTYPPYRLFVLPCDEWNDPDCLVAKLLRILLCECTLACFLLIWLVLGALTFYLTEGPYEYIKVTEFQSKENSIIISLATDLRQLDDPNKPVWKEIIEKYIFKHKEIVEESITDSYGNQGVYWTFAGSITLAISLLTTLGLATPLPLTTMGNIEAFFFTLIGVPIHFLFLTHLGRTIALKIQLFSKELEIKFSHLRRKITNVKRFGKNIKNEKELWPDKMFSVDFMPSPWLRFFPIVSTQLYYIIGVLVFGLARAMNFPRIFFFPLDFARCNTSTSNISRIGYAWYLEGLAILTSINIALLRDSPFSVLIPVGIKYNFMTNTLE